MERSRNLDVLVRLEREKRQRSEGREVIPEGLAGAVEATRAEIDRVMESIERRKVKLKSTHNA